MATLYFSPLGGGTSSSTPNTLSAYRVGNFNDSKLEWNLQGLAPLGNLGAVLFKKSSLSGMSLITAKKGNYEIGVTKNGKVVGSINLINNSRGIINFVNPIQFAAGDEINFKSIRNYASLGRVIATPTIEYSGITKFNSLDNFSSNIPDVFLFNLTMPSTFDNDNHIIFETGNTTSGVTFYHNQGAFKAYIGSFEKLDFDIANVFQAGKSYILLVELIRKNNLPLAKVYVGEMVSGNFPRELTLIGEKQYNGTIDWTADDNSGLGTIGQSGSFKGGVVRSVPDATWRQFDDEVFNTFNGHSGVTSSFRSFINPQLEQETPEQVPQPDATSSAHYKLEDLNVLGVFLDYAFAKRLFISGVRIIPRADIPLRARDLFIRLLLNGQVVYTSPKHIDSPENTFTPIEADQIQLVANTQTNVHTQFNYIEVQRYVETSLQMDNFTGNKLDLQFFSDKNKDGVWEDGTPKSDPEKAVIKAYFK